MLRPEFSVRRLGQRYDRGQVDALREGYDVTEVDDFVDRVLATVNGLTVERPVTAEEIRNVRFSPVRLSEGYDLSEVDEFLDTAETWLSEPR